MLFLFFILVLHRNHFLHGPTRIELCLLCLNKGNDDDDVDDGDNNYGL